MYEPTPARPKKTEIVRSRTGCTSCRQRRKKCDEKKPTCSSCVKLGRRCEQAVQTLEFRSVNIQPRAHTQPQPQSKKQTDLSCFYIATYDEESLQRSQHPRLSRDTNSTTSTPSSSSSISSSSASSPFSSGIVRARSPSWNNNFPSSTNFDGFDLVWPATTENSHGSTSPPTENGITLATSRIQLDFGPSRYTCMRMPPAIMPTHDYNYIITFYIDIWRDHCLPALHISFHHIEDLCGQSQLIRHTMATLSACRLSRTLPQRRLCHASDASSLCFRPDVSHEYLSGRLYGCGIRKMSQWNREELDSQPVLALAVLVLFCYLESSMGNFAEFQVHSSAIEKLLASYPDPVLSTGGGLFAAWVEVKMQNWWRRAHFGVPNFFQDWSAPLVDPTFQAMSTTPAHRRASVLWVLCESHRLSTARINACYNDSNNYQVEARLFGTFSNPTGKHRPSLEELLPMMSIQSERLDEWYASLGDHELPEIQECQDIQNESDTQRPEDAAIYFSSHDQAMNFAYYATARVMQCMKPLQSLCNTSFSCIDEPDEETETWVQILLRIAAGINWDECVRLNVYTIGLAGLLLACALRSRKLATGLWIQQWLEARLGEDGFEEGNLPVFQIVDALRIINRERSQGRDVISMFQTVDDGGGTGKFGSYCSQTIQSFLVYARCSETGDLYSYEVSLGDFKLSR